jgi:hypothetical protein
MSLEGENRTDAVMRRLRAEVKLEPRPGRRRRSERAPRPDHERFVDGRGPFILIYVGVALAVIALILAWLLG